MTLTSSEGAVERSAASAAMTKAAIITATPMPALGTEFNVQP